MKIEETPYIVRSEAVVTGCGYGATHPADLHFNFLAFPQSHTGGNSIACMRFTITNHRPTYNINKAGLF